MRVSDDDRERTARQLQRAFTEGRLTQPEFEDRVGLAFAAKTYADLLALISDLPADQPPPPADDVVVLESTNGHVRRGGEWVVPRRLRISCKYGNVALDLTEAVITHPVVEIELRLKYGSARIVLPEGAGADIDRFSSRHGSAVSRVPGLPHPGAVRVVISGETGYGHLSVDHPRRRLFGR